MQLCATDAWCVFARPAVVVGCVVCIAASLGPSLKRKPTVIDVLRIDRETSMHANVAAAHLAWMLLLLVYALSLFFPVFKAQIQGTYNGDTTVFELFFLYMLTSVFEKLIREWYTHVWLTVPIAALWLWVDILFFAYREQLDCLKLLACGGVTFAALDTYRFGRIVSEHAKTLNKTS